MLSPAQIGALLAPYENVPRGAFPPQIAPRGTISSDPAQNAPRGTIGGGLAEVHEKLALYLDLLLKWNARTNLTSVRDPEQIVKRHFGESIFAAQAIEAEFDLQPGSTLLDYGSGAGFPGLPIQLLYPQLHVTLAESQGKKSAFLREAVRVLQTGTEIWPRRVESMPAARRFDVVTLRAVDEMHLAVSGAADRAALGLAILTTASREVELPMFHVKQIPLPGSTDRVVLIARR